MDACNLEVHDDDCNVDSEVVIWEFDQVSNKSEGVEEWMDVVACV